MIIEWMELTAIREEGGSNLFSFSERKIDFVCDMSGNFSFV